MTRTSSHGAGSRHPVYFNKRRVPGLWARSLADGSTVYEFAGRLGGKVTRKTLIARTPTDAVAELRALQVDYARGELQRSPSTALTVSEVAAEWFEHLDGRVALRGTRRGMSDATAELYRQRMKDYILPQLGHRPIDRLTVDDVRKLLDRLPSTLKPATMTGILVACSAFCRYAIKRRLLERNPVRDLDRDERPGTERQTEPRYLTHAEIERLFASLGDTFRPVAATCAYAGLRISETLGLRWRDVDLAAGTLTVSGQLARKGGGRVPPKSAASRATITLLPALARELREHRSRQASRDLRLVHADALVFTTSRGKPQSRRNALRAVYAAGDAVGLNTDGREPVGLHDLRHSLSGIAFESALSLPEVSVLLRHGSPRVTAQVYAGLAENGREQAAAKLAEAGFGA